MKTVNPFKHAFPHARLYNVKLTSITRLSKMPPNVCRYFRFVENNDRRNFMISIGICDAMLNGWRNG
jgi:hypothetical protein